MYQLKPGQENFSVIDGEYTGKNYQRGEKYDVVPPNKIHCFEEITEVSQEIPRKYSKKEKESTEII